MIAFVLQKSRVKDFLEIAASATMFFVFYPFAIAWSPVYIVLYYVRVYRKVGTGGMINEICSWFSSYPSSTNKSSNGTIPTVPEVPEPEPTES
jgi:hypothetical protein